MQQYTYTKMETRLANLFASRRLRFSFTNSLTGNFRWKRMPLIILNTLASCLSFPILFYLSYHTLAVYPDLNLKPLDMLSVLFIAAAASILIDVFIGYIYDKSIKPLKHGDVSPRFKHVCSVLSTIGLVASLITFFRIDVSLEYATSQYRTTLLLIMLFFTATNCTSFKNSSNYTPSQEDRRTIFHLEYFLKGLIMFLFVSVPYIVKFYTDDCDCGDGCSVTPTTPQCTACLLNCDNFGNLDYYRIPLIVFTCVFGLANILVQFLVNPRKDENREDISTTFNRRLVEIYTNKFFLKTVVLSAIEFSILFGFAIWSYQYIDQEIPLSPSCVTRYGRQAYVCTKSFWVQMTVFIVFLASAVTFTLSIKLSFIFLLSVLASLLTFIAGILIIVIPTGDTITYCVITAFIALFYATMAATKLVYSDGIFYDEYKSGSTQSNLPAGLFLLSMKLGFLLILAFHLTLFDANGYDRTNPAIEHSNNKGFGIYVIVASIVGLIIKLWFSRYNLQAFDKIQVAIERNLNLQEDDISFYDPIAKGPVKCPVMSYDPVEKKLIKLMYNLNPSQMAQVINGKQAKVQSGSLFRLTMLMIVAMALTAIVIIFGRILSTPWGWFLLIALIGIPVCVLVALYEYNVWASANALDSAKYKSADRFLLLKFVRFIDKNE